MESQVLEQNDLTIACFVDGFFHFRSNAVASEDDLLAEEFLKFGDDRFQAVFGVCFAVRATEVGHEDNSFCAMVDGVFDRG